MIKWLRALALSASVLVASAMASPLTDLNKPIVVDAHHPIFEVVLKANPTTGYQWLLVPDHSDMAQIVPVDYSYEAPRSKLVGAPGRAVFKFRVKNPDMPLDLKLGFVYARPWQKIDLSQLQSVQVVVH